MDQKIQRWRRRVGAVTSLISALILLAWFVQWDRLITVLPESVPMQFNTALLFVMCGIDLSFRSEYRRNHRALPSLVLVLAVVTLGQDFSRLDYGLDSVFIDSHIDTMTPNPGRMAPGTAICFAAFALNRFRPKSDYAVTGLIISLFAVLGYAFGVPQFYHWSPLVTAMALNTSILFVCLFSADLFSKCEFKTKPNG